MCELCWPYPDVRIDFGLCTSARSMGCSNRRTGMGRWMEVVRQRPADGQHDHGQVYEDLIVREIAPHPLMHAFGALCQANPGKREVIGEFFPTLEAIGLGSPRYTGEDLWLSADQLGQLLEEFRRLRRV